MKRRQDQKGAPSKQMLRSGHGPWTRNCFARFPGYACSPQFEMTHNKDFIDNSSHASWRLISNNIRISKEIVYHVK